MDTHSRHSTLPYLLEIVQCVLFLHWGQGYLVHVSERQPQVLDMAGHCQLDLPVAEEEGAVKLGHLEEESEQVVEGGPREELGEMLKLFGGGEEAGLLQRTDRKRVCGSFSTPPKAL